MSLVEEEMFFIHHPRMFPELTDLAHVLGIPQLAQVLGIPVPKVQAKGFPKLDSLMQCINHLHQLFRQIVQCVP